MTGNRHSTATDSPELDIVEDFMARHFDQMVIEQMLDREIGRLERKKANLLNVTFKDWCNSQWAEAVGFQKIKF